MKILKILIQAFFLIALITMPVQSQVKKVAQTGIQFLKIDVGARASSMAGAMTLTGYDANAVFYNPAGIARMNYKTDVMFNNTQWIADIKYNSIAAAYTVEDIGTFAIQGLFADYGDIMGTRVASNEQGYISTGNLSVNAYCFGLSYARSLSEKFTVGGTVKYVSQSLGNSLMPDGSTKENKVSGAAFDFGTIYYPGWKSFRFGFSIRNFAKEFEYEKESFELPLTFNIGFAMDLFDFVDIKNQSLLFSIDAVHPRDYSERLKFGAEYTLLHMVALRVGYKTNHDIESFSAGIGLFYEISGVNIKADYSYSSMEFFDAVNRFTVGFSF